MDDMLRQHCTAVALLQPAYIATPLAAPVLQNKALMGEIEERTPMRRVGQPEEISGDPGAASGHQSEEQAFVFCHLPMHTSIAHSQTYGSLYSAGGTANTEAAGPAGSACTLENIVARCAMCRPGDIPVLGGGRLHHRAGHQCLRRPVGEWVRMSLRNRIFLSVGCSC